MNRILLGLTLFIALILFLFWHTLIKILGNEDIPIVLVWTICVLVLVGSKLLIDHIFDADNQIRKNFNYLFDSIASSIFVSFGFIILALFIFENQKFTMKSFLEGFVIFFPSGVIGFVGNYFEAENLELTVGVVVNTILITGIFLLSLYFFRSDAVVSYFVLSGPFIFDSVKLTGRLGN